MSLYSIVLLATISILACADSTSAATLSTTRQTIPTELTWFDGYYQNGVPVKRFLRTSETTDVVVGEVRAGFDKVANYIKSGTSKLVDSVKLQSYVLQKKTGVQVMKKLHFGDDAVAALTITKLDGLKTYITMYNRKFPDNKISMVETLTTRYKDDALASALIKVQRETQGTDIKVFNMVKQLREDQREFWFKNTKSIDEVVGRLNVADDGYKAIISSKTEALNDYITFFNKKTGGQTTLLDTLTVGFGGEAKLVRILSLAKEDPLTMRNAYAMLDDLLHTWQTKAVPVHPQSVLMRLDLNLDPVNLMILTKYTSVFNKNNPTRKVSELDTLAAYYGDDVMANYLAFAKHTPGTEAMMTRLQTQQFEKWASGKSLDYAFKALGVDTPDLLLPGPNLRLDALDDFVKVFNAKNPLEKTTVLEVLSKGFGGEDKFALLVARALERQQSTPAFMHSAASTYQKELFQRWANKDWDAMSVLVKVFKVDESKIASVGAQEKAIIDQYRTFYARNHGPGA